MAIPVPYAFSGASRLSPRASAPVLLVAIALCGCSFDLGSWSSAPDKETVPKAAPAEAEVSDAQAATQRSGAGTVRKNRRGARRVRSRGRAGSLQRASLVQSRPAPSERTATSAGDR